MINNIGKLVFEMDKAQADACAKMRGTRGFIKYLLINVILSMNVVVHGI